MLEEVGGSPSNVTSSSPTSVSSKETFQAFKAICVPLLSNSLLSPDTIPRASGLLLRLESLLEVISEREAVLPPSTIEYVFFPLAHILQRNAISSIPDVIMEKLMGVIALLFDHWWWSCQIEVWEQTLMLSAGILGRMDAHGLQKGKERERDDGAKRATIRCIWAVLRRRTETTRNTVSSEERFAEFRSRSQTPKLLPILGQTLTPLLEPSQSVHHELQTISLQVIHTLITDYFPESFIPTILPGVASTMAKVALGRRENKGWSRGDTVDQALAILQATIVVAIGDEICKAEGALRVATSLEDLDHVSETDPPPRPATSKLPSASMPYITPRTSVWLAASTSQLHMVLNTLSPLLSHPKHVALLALSRFCHALLSSTSQTLPDTQPLLLSFLLSLSTSQFPEVAESAHAHLLRLLLPPSPVRFTLSRILLRLTSDNLTSLPRLLPSHSDTKVEHLALQVSAACRLSTSVFGVSDGIGRILGPTGGIEKWGWSLLWLLEFVMPPHLVSTVQPPHSLLESGPESLAMHPFPEVNMKDVSSQSTRKALDDMFRSLGNAAGSECLFAVEWLVGVARRGRGRKEVAALWCAGRILEGVCSVSLESTDVIGQAVPKRVEKLSRWIAKVIAEFWDPDEEPVADQQHAANDASFKDSPENDGRLPLEYVKGLNPLVTRFDIETHDGKPNRSSPPSDRILHQVLSLQLLSITSAILRTQFMHLLLHTLYPVLHSLVSPNSYVSSSALATLHYISSATAYASPSNLLLANFDYALDGVARRLSRRQLDPEATKILVVLVRLVGKDVVSRARDVVEACFDRLDEFHGYSVLVEGLIEVLTEVVKVVQDDQDEHETSGCAVPPKASSEDHMQSFIEWYQHRNDRTDMDSEDYGPAPRESWENLAGNRDEREMDENVPAESQDDPPLTPTQVLTQQILTHSINFLTHPSPLIRTRILGLLELVCPTLSESALLPSIHSAWPYILNRMGDSEIYVVGAAVSLIASLAERVGEFMATRIWKDVWPRFRVTLSKLEAADAHSALARRGQGAVGTESAYTQSHRLYKAILRTMRAVVEGAQLRSDILWELLVACRRFLHAGAHQELQRYAREVYLALKKENEDVVWLVLSATMGGDVTGADDQDLCHVAFLKEEYWDIEQNVKLILGVVS